MRGLHSICGGPLQTIMPVESIRPRARSEALLRRKTASSPRFIVSGYVAARLIKLVGNFLKGPCYLFYLLCPSRRFVIPADARPLVPSRTAQSVPRTVWLTNFSARVSLPVYLNYLFNRLMAPAYRFRFMDDRDAACFVARECPGRTADLYGRLQIGAARADLWRLLVLQRYGGVYMDIDAHVVRPMQSVVSADASEVYLEHKAGALTNYFLASIAGNPRLAAVIEAVLKNIETCAGDDVAGLTGPGVLDAVVGPLTANRAYYKVTCYQGTFTNEFFQYLDSAEEKWFRQQRRVAIVKPDTCLESPNA